MIQLQLYTTVTNLTRAQTDSEGGREGGRERGREGERERERERESRETDSKSIITIFTVYA